MSVYDATYKTLGHTHPRIYTVADMGKYSPPHKGMELERYSFWNLLGINTERSLENHRKFHPENN